MTDTSNILPAPTSKGMRGTNPIRPAVVGSGDVLDVVEIFPTLQGEGPYVGMPAVFIRLGGCNLACSFCDTEFEHFSPMRLDTIWQAVATYPHIHLVVITGGEPLRQPIEKLCELLIAEDKLVQIETNGTLWRNLPADVDVVCSPKPVRGVYYPLRPDVLARAGALKFIVSVHDDAHKTVPDVGQFSNDELIVYVQPMDEADATKNAANQAYAAEICLAHGYRLSLQTHKILGIA